MGDAFDLQMEDQPVINARAWMKSPASDESFSHCEDSCVYGVRASVWVGVGEHVRVLAC